MSHARVRYRRASTLRGRALLDLLARQGGPAAERLAAAHEMVRLAERPVRIAGEDLIDARHLGEGA